MSVARSRRFIATGVTVIVGVVTLATFVRSRAARMARCRYAGQGRGEGRGRGPAMKLSDPVITDPAIQNGGIDMHAHQDPGSSRPTCRSGCAIRRRDGFVYAGQGCRHARLRHQGASRSERRPCLLHAQAPSRYGDLRRHGLELHHRVEGQPLGHHPHGRDEGRLGADRVDAELGFREQLAQGAQLHDDPGAAARPVLRPTVRVGGAVRRWRPVLGELSEAVRRRRSAAGGEGRDQARRDDQDPRQQRRPDSRHGPQFAGRGPDDDQGGGERRRQTHHHASLFSTSST